MKVMKVACWLAAVVAMVAGTAFAETAPRVTPQNWYWGPANVWSYQNTRRIFPSARVTKGDRPTSPLERREVNLDDLAFDDPASGRRMKLSEMYGATFTNAFLVMKDGKIVVERYFNGMQPEDPHLLMSVTKSVVGAMTGVIVDQGRLDLEAPITSYVPEVGKTAYAGATVRHLLDMSVGLDFNEDYASKTSDLYRLDEAAGWVERGPNAPAGLQDYLKSLVNRRGSHGEAFLYASPNTDLMGWVLERATNTDLAKLLSTELWSKLGAEEDAYILLDGYQNAYADPGFNATLRDMGRFGQMMLQDGYYNGQQIVPAKWVRDIRQNGDKAAWRRSPAYAFFSKLVGFESGAYRSYWYVAGEEGIYLGIGLAGQLLVVDPKNKIVIVKFSAFASPELEFLSTHLAATRAIIRTLSAESER